jgi:microcystin-dependent protein
MSGPYVGEIRMFAGNYAPAGWMFCAGQLLPISEYETLFNLIGTTYGGDGQNTFALPNLQSRVPIHVGTGFALGQSGGAETVTVTTAQMPAHNHLPIAAAANQTQGPTTSSTLASATSNQQDLQIYNAGPGTIAFNGAAVTNTGGSQPHDNMIPFLVVNFIISLFGVFPSQS